METNFRTWFFNTWEKTEGLICQADAARLLGVTRQSIQTRIKKGSLTTHDYNDKGKKITYISLKELAKIKLKKG